jgi:WD40 repeat protein
MDRVAHRSDKRSLSSTFGPLMKILRILPSVTGLLGGLALMSQAVCAVQPSVTFGDHVETAPELVIDTKGLWGDEVKSIDLSSDGRYVAAAAGKEVRVWEISTGKPIAVLRGYREPGAYTVGNVNEVRFVPDSLYLVVGIVDNSTSGSTRMYDLRRPNDMYQLVEGHLGCTSNVAISPDGKRMITWGCDGQLRFLEWSDASNKWTTKYSQHTPSHQASYTPLDLKHRSLLFKHGLFKFSNDNDLLLWLSYEPSLSLSGAIVGDPLPSILHSYSGDRPIVGFDNWPDALHQPLHWVQEIQLPFSKEGRALSTAVDLHFEKERWLSVGGYTTTPDATKYWVAAWERPNSAPSAVYRGHRTYPSAVVHSPALAMAASGDKMGEAHIWDTATEKSLLKLKPKNKQLYGVAWSEDGHTLWIADRHYPTGKYDCNHFGPLNKQFDLTRRLILDREPLDAPSGPVIPLPNSSLGTGLSLMAKRRQSKDEVPIDLHLVGGATSINLNPQAQIEHLRDKLPASRLASDETFGRPYCYQALDFQNTSAARPRVVVGTDRGQLWQFTVERARFGSTPLMLAERRFVGHTSTVTSASVSPRGDVLATSSWDGTVRLWKLGAARPTGDVDFEFDGSSVTYVPPGSQAEQLGLQKGDVVISFDGKPFFERFRGMARGDYRPDDVVEVVFSRNEAVGGTLVATRMVRQFHLQPAPDVVEPFLTVFFSNDGEWVAWTPRGYYDSSPNGEQYVGWHVNRRRDESADFFGAQQFAKHLYRPDIISQVAKTGDEANAVRLTNQPLKNRPTPPRDDVDLRDANFLSDVMPPRVEIVSPELGQVVSQEQVTVETRVAASEKLPVHNVKFHVNGRPVPQTAQRVEELHENNEVVTVYRQSLTLEPGENVVSIAAENKESTSSVESLQLLRYDQESEEAGDLYVLAIGISDYARPQFQLRYSHKDAFDFAEAWKRQEGRRFRHVHTRVVTDREATVGGIKEGMQWLSENATEPQDIAYVFLSGHGVFDRFDTWYFGSCDLDPNALLRTGVSQAEISHWLDGQLGCRTILFADTCHAGAFRGTGVRNRQSQGREVWRGMATFALVSCLAAEESFEYPQLRNSAFTKALLNGLECSACDINRDGQLSFDELAIYVKHEVPKLTNGNQHPAAQVSLNLSNLQLANISDP